jgi:hypothetical protein
MPYQIQLRRGTTSQNNSFTGAIGELTVDTTTNVIRLHDGSQAGGYSLVSTAATQTLTNKTLTAATATGGLTVDGTGILTVSNTTASTSVGVGALVVAGGITSNDSIRASGAVYAGGVNLKPFSIAMAAALS